MERIKFSNYEVGDSLPSLSTNVINQMDLVRYAGASGDFNPIHNDVEFAKKVGLGGTIAHGMFSMAQLGRMLTNSINPLQIKNFNVKFKGMVKPGQTLTCTAKVKRKKEDAGVKLLTISIEGVAGDQVCVSGEAVVVCD